MGYPNPHYFCTTGHQPLQNLQSTPPSRFPETGRDASDAGILTRTTVQPNPLLLGVSSPRSSDARARYTNFEELAEDLHKSWFLGEEGAPLTGTDGAGLGGEMVGWLIEPKSKKEQEVRLSQHVLKQGNFLGLQSFLKRN